MAEGQEVGRVISGAPGPPGQLRHAGEVPPRSSLSDPSVDTTGSGSPAAFTSPMTMDDT
jgi:hypothetical protein